MNESEIFNNLPTNPESAVPTEGQNPEKPPIRVTADTASVDDRRQYVARIPVEIDLQITTPDKKGIARSIDISVSGLLVQTLIELRWEERLILTILHPEEDTHVCAIVARIVDSENASTSGYKYGLRIVSDDLVIWQGVLRRLIL